MFSHIYCLLDIISCIIILPHLTDAKIYFWTYPNQQSRFSKLLACKSSTLVMRLECRFQATEVDGSNYDISMLRP